MRILIGKPFENINDRFLSLPNFLGTALTQMSDGCRDIFTHPLDFRF
jgi:hypothetical protein